MPRRRPRFPDEDFGRAAPSTKLGARDEVVIGTEKVAGGRGDIRPGGRGPRLKPGSKANPRATYKDTVPGYKPSRDEHSDELLSGRTPRGEAALQTVQPTNTTNGQKPRTLSAGYDRKTQTLTVTFRDGTLWNYYGVTYQMWTAFKASPSPGRYIRTRLDFKAYGPPNGQVGDTVEPNEAELLAAQGVRDWSDT